MKKNQLKKLAMALVVIMFGFQAFAQGRIDLAPKGVRSTEAQNVTMSGFTASFSFNSIESELVSTERGNFSMISMENSLPAGNDGEPQVPVMRKLIAIPFGANPVVSVKNYTVNEYNLADYGIEKLYPMQPSQSKGEKDVKFVYNEAAYAVRGYNERPIAEVEVMGTLRGIQLGALQVNTVSYNAAANTIRVYNDIELEVSFEDADLALTEKTLVNTYSPYFRTVYAALYNERAILDIYDEHPDLWAVPVKVLVVANRMFEAAMQPWITWKTEKGFVMDVNYTDEIGTTAQAIKTFITNKYNEGVANGQAPTFIIIIGDKPQVPESQMGSATHKVTDLYYYAVAGNDVFGDMFHSRFTCETVQEFQNVLDKSMMYEQYTMPDPSYLSNVLLIAGWDSSWNPRIGKPTIQYATNYYYNAAHGFVQVNEFLQTPYNQPYASMNTGVNFVNYTAHGGDTSWSDPSFSTSDVNNLTNTGKYFLAMGNCCLAANWGYSSKSLGEAMIIAQNKGAYAYIGSPVETYWYEDYYFGVGATNTMNQMPTYENSSMGTYDAQFRDDWNCVTAVPYVGNLAVAYAHANGYQSSSTATDQYYWEAYHVLGDGTVTPYHVNPVANNVSHLPTLPIGMDTYEVSADPGSYVGISKDGVLCGAGEIGEEGVALIPIEPVTSGGDVKIVVTHPQRQPYIATVPAAAMTGAYVAVDSYELSAEQANYGETLDMDITLKNVGTQTANNITATLTTDCDYVTVMAATASLASLAPDATATVEGFQFEVAGNVPDGTKAQFYLDVTDGTDTWQGKFKVTLHAPVLSIDAWTVSETDLSLTFKNEGSAPFVGGELNIISCSPELVFTPDTFTFSDAVAGGETINFTSAYTVDPSVELGTTFEVAYDMTTGLFNLTDIITVSYGSIQEDFESGVFGDNWTFSQPNAWTIVDGGRGTKCAKSMNMGQHSTDYWATLTVDVLAAGNLTFMYKVSSEISSTGTMYDKLTFYMDNQQKGQWAGNVDWTEFTQPVTVGQHTFKWSYSKDSSVSSGDDCAWIDNIVFPPTNVITFIAPATDLVAEVEGANVNLSWTASPEAVNYVIKRNGETLDIVAETSYNDVLPKDGIYTYAVYAANVGGGMSAPVTVIVEATFDVVEVVEAVKISVYPNPTNGVLNINTNANNYEYQIINSIGQVVLSGNATGKTTVNVEDLNGVYVLRIIADGEVVVRKVTVK